MELTFEVDLDAECVWLDDAWMSRDDLKRKITGMLEAGDYRVARPSEALESLTKALTSARLLALRISPEMSEALNVVAQQSGRPVGALAREALAAFLQGAAGVEAAPAAAAPVPSAPAPSAPGPQIPPIPAIPAIPASAGGAPAIPALPVRPVAAPAAREAAPAEEAVSPEEAATAVTLTPKRKDGESEIEQGWFGK